MNKIRQLAIFAAVGFGCTYRTPEVHVPPTFSVVSPAGIDLTTVDVVARGERVSPEVAAHVKETVREILVGAVPQKEATSARLHVSARVEIYRSEDWVANAGRVDGCGAVPVVLAAPAGAKIEDESLAVELSIELDGRQYHGRGAARKEGSVYASARRRALAVALEQALENAAKQPTP